MASGFFGAGLGTQKAGMETISPLLDHGVAVAIDGSESRQAARHRNHPLVTSVSELSNTTSVSASRMPRLTVATKSSFISFINKRRYGFASLTQDCSKGNTLL